jgi:predicted transcriptional regulator
MSKDIKSELIPNTYPVPNWIIDRGIWALLVDPERNCYQIVIRKTLGWWKRTDRIAKSVIVELSGLSPATVTKTMKALVEFGLVDRVSENNPDNEGIEWGYQPDHTKVNVELLLARFEAKSKINKKRAAKMRQWQGGGMSDIPPMSDNTGGDMSDNEHKTILNQSIEDAGASSKAKPKIKIEIKKTPKSKKIEVPEQWRPLYDAFVKGKRSALNQSELKFWLFGSSAENGDAKGIKHYYQAGITPEEITLAFAYAKRQRMTIKNPNSLFVFADEIHLSKVKISHGENVTIEDERERIRNRISAAKMERVA